MCGGPLPKMDVIDPAGRSRPASRAAAVAAPGQWVFAATVFTSSFLLFLVQPLVSKQILPWFGGSAAVWATCTVFFQVLLLAGYAYAHALTRLAHRRRQVLVHALLLLAGLALMPIAIGAGWKPKGGEDPALRILLLLGATIGLPYLLLSATGPLIQAWVSRCAVDARVYRYFSLSNLASLLALASYPFLIEPQVPLWLQARAWSLVFGAFVMLCGACALLYWRHGGADVGTSGPAGVDQPAPTAARQLLWLLLSAAGTWLLVAVTNHITQNVASIPFMWLLPLTLYLLSFVLTFDSDRWYARRWALAPAALALLLCAWGLAGGLPGDLRVKLPVYAGGAFVLWMVLHGELAALRPAPCHLTRFYLMLALGGALGGILVGLVAPRVLDGYYELGAGLALIGLLLATVLRGQRRVAAAALLVAAACVAGLVQQVRTDLVGAHRMARSFYGTLQVYDDVHGEPHERRRMLFNATIKHGSQYLAESRRREPTVYYGPQSGVGRVLTRAQAGPRRVGAIGLGAGVMATYGRHGDAWRFYELDPLAVDFARGEFTFLADSAAAIDIVLGDARLSLERESPQDFDLLVVDAFSGGAVPVHLITREAVAVYERHLARGGILAFHVTNGHLNLPPVVQGIAQAQGLQSRWIHDAAEDSGFRATDWVLVARDAADLSFPEVAAAAQPFEAMAGLQPWTDDFNDLFKVLR